MAKFERDFCILSILFALAVWWAVGATMLYLSCPATVYTELIDVRWYPVEKTYVVEKPVILNGPRNECIPLYKEKPRPKQYAESFVK